MMMIEEMGDLDRHFGYEDKDVESMKFTPGQVKTMRKKEWEALTPAQELELLKQGFLFAKWSDGPSPTGPLKGHLLNLSNVAELTSQEPRPGQMANFLLLRDTTPMHAVVNGFWVDLQKGEQAIPNTMGY